MCYCFMVNNMCFRIFFFFSAPIARLRITVIKVMLLKCHTDWQQVKSYTCNHMKTRKTISFIFYTNIFGLKTIRIKAVITLVQIGPSPSQVCMEIFKQFSDSVSILSSNRKEVQNEPPLSLNIIIYCYFQFWTYM